MKTFNDYKTTVHSLFDNAEKFAGHAGYEGASKNILKIKTEFLTKELMVITCGEMRRGKSSLLTALLEEDKLFPIDINTCTNVITVVRYGLAEKIEVILEKTASGDIQYEVVEIGRNEIEQYVTEYGNENNKKRVNCLKIEIPNEKLKEGFVFVDTPGVGSLNFEHAQVTYGFLPNADVMLFVSDVLSPLTDSELKFLEKGFGFCKNIIFPLTKTDKRNIEEINSTTGSNREKIANITKLTDDRIHIVPVSSRMKLKYLFTHEEGYLAKSNFAQLEGLIWKTIFHNRAQILVLPFLRQLHEELMKIRGNISIQLEAMEQNTEIVNKLSAELQSKLAKQQLLSEGNAKWKVELQYNLTNVSFEITEEIQNISISITEKMNALVAQQGAANKIDSIASEINEMLSSLVIDSRETISTKILDITSELSAELGLSLDVNEDAMNKVGFAHKQNIEYATVQKTVANAVIDKGRKIAMNSMGGAAIGGVVGAALGGFVGLMLGGPAGAYALGTAAAQWGAGLGAAGATAKGTIDVLKNSKEEDIPAIRMAFANYIVKSINSIRSGVNMCIRELTKELMQELTDQINGQISQLEITSGQIKQNLALKKSEIPKQTAKLQMQLSMVEGLEKNTIQLSEEAVNQNITNT